MALTLLQMQNGVKSYGTKVLFDHASFAVNEGEHIGVIGPNGAGKTTLFKALAEQDSLDSGEITRASILRLGYLEQESDWNVDEGVEDYLANNCIKPIWELKQLGLSLGLTPVHFSSPLKSLSGGYRMRVKLLYLIGQEPNLLLLDEPTNFLDLETLIVLEDFLREYKGAFLLISHDREFLRRVTDHIVEIEAGEITKFNGNLDDYFEQKAMLQELLQKQALSQDAKRKSILDFVNRFGAKATKARQAQSRLKALEKMEVIEVKKSLATSRIQLPRPMATGKLILEAQDLNCGYGEKKILSNVKLRLERGDHLGIVGVNGAGKSTLLKTLALEIPALNGQIQWGHQVFFSYFAQHTPEKLLPEETVIGSLQAAAHPDCLQQDILNMAGSLLFSGDTIYKKIKVLSGGEKSRVALGQMLLKKAPFLLLDEPTNHLDFDTVEALTEALADYEGTLITISHDRAFIGRVATKILEIQNGKLTFYPGTYDEYVWSVQKGVLSERSGSLENDSTVAIRNNSFADKKFNYKDEKKRLESEMRRCSKGAQDLEVKIQALAKKRDSLLESLVNKSGAEAQELAKLLHQTSADIESFEMQILDLLQLEEDMKKQIDILVRNA